MITFAIWLDLDSIPIYHTKKYANTIISAYYINNRFIIEYE